jgi:hypothetical protein
MVDLSFAALAVSLIIKKGKKKGLPPLKIIIKKNRVALELAKRTIIVSFATHRHLLSVGVA